MTVYNTILPHLEKFLKSCNIVNFFLFDCWYQQAPTFHGNEDGQRPTWHLFNGWNSHGLSPIEQFPNEPRRKRVVVVLLPSTRFRKSFISTAGEKGRRSPPSSGGVRSRWSRVSYRIKQTGCAAFGFRQRNSSLSMAQSGTKLRSQSQLCATNSSPWIKLSL